MEADTRDLTEECLQVPIVRLRGSPREGMLRASGRLVVRRRDCLSRIVLQWGGAGDGAGRAGGRGGGERCRVRSAKGRMRAGTTPGIPEI